MLREEGVTVARNLASGAGGIDSVWTEPRGRRRYGPAISGLHPGSEFYLQPGVKYSMFPQGSCSNGRANRLPFAFWLPIPHALLGTASLAELFCTDVELTNDLEAALNASQT